MFDINSQERQAHHQFMTLSPEQHKEIGNHELFGNAAAYHAAAAYTDHVEKNGVPASKPEAEQLILGYAKDFVHNNIDGKGLKLEKDQAMKFATQSLSGIQASDPEAWKVSHATVGKTFDEWASPEKENGDTYNNNCGGTINVNNNRGW